MLLHDMVSLGETGLGRRRVADLEQEGLVFRAVFP